MGHTKKDRINGSQKAQIVKNTLIILGLIIIYIILEIILYRLKYL